jgi:hypothetical protein
VSFKTILFPPYFLQELLDIVIIVIVIISGYFKQGTYGSPATPPLIMLPTPNYITYFSLRAFE